MGTVQARAHGVPQRQLPEWSVRTGSRGPVRTKSPGTFCPAPVVLHLLPRGLVVLIQLLWGVPHQLVVVGLRT